MVTEPLKWYDENADNPPWVKALAEVRHRATREGWCYPRSKQSSWRSISMRKRPWVVNRRWNGTP
jgi:hypothetical protein